MAKSDHESYKAKVSRSISNDRKIARGKELERRRIAERNEANRREIRQQFLDTRARLLESHLDHKEDK